MKKKSLQEAEVMLPTLYDLDRFNLAGVPGASVILDKQYRHVFASSFASKFFGISHDEIIGMSLTELFGDTIGDQLKRLVDDAFAGSGIQKILEFPPHGSDGKTRYHELWMEQCKFQNAPHVMVMIMDITTRMHRRHADIVQTQSLLKDLENQNLQLLKHDERVRIVGNVSADGYWEKNLLTGKRYCSDGFKRLVGLTDEPLDDGPEFWKMIIYPPDLGYWMSCLEKYRNSVAPFKTTLRLVHRDGSLIWVNIRGVTLRGDNGEPLRIVGSVSDITALQMAEERLKEVNQNLEVKIAARTQALTEEKERIARIASLAPGVIFSISIDRRLNLKFENISDRYDEIFGSANSRQSKPATFGELLHLVHEDHRDRVSSEIICAGRMLKPWQGEFPINRTDRTVWVNISAAPLQHSDGTLWWHGFVQDITQRIVQEQEASKLRADAEERKILHYQQMAEQQKLLTHRFINLAEEERRAVAYELHDGLTQHVMSAHLFLDTYSARVGSAETSLQATLARGLECLELAVKESRRLVNGLRALYLDDMGLAGAVAQVFADEAAAAGWKDTVYVHNLSGTRFDPEVETAIFRIAQEALVNVRKHATASKVTVELVKIQETALPELVLRVTDYGSGFDVDAGAKKHGHFGLRSMQERAALLSGRFTIKSHAGKGTRITMHMPIEQDSNQQPATFEI